jgi:hypothetical protein
MRRIAEEIMAIRWQERLIPLQFINGLPVTACKILEPDPEFLPNR